jgi:hypothetical protein
VRPGSRRDLVAARHGVGADVAAGGLAGPFDQDTVAEDRPGPDQGGPLVTLVRRRTVAKVDSIGLVVLRWIQCSAGKS